MKFKSISYGISTRRLSHLCLASARGRKLGRVRQTAGKHIISKWRRKTCYFPSFVPSPTARSAVRWPKARAGEGIIFLYIYSGRAGEVSFYIYIYIHGFRSLKNAVCKVGDWYVVEQTVLRYRVEANRFGLVIFFPCMDLSQVVYII